MKKILAAVLAVMLLLTGMSAGLAEEAETAENPNYEELTVAVTTPMTGSFFTSLWGNGTSDMDVRAMIHGYNLIHWNAEDGVFEPDHSVISGIVATEDGTEGSDRTYTIALYDDLRYSDGTPVTAWDYAFSILLTMSPEAEAIGGKVNHPAHLVGYEEYISGQAQTLAGVRVLNDTTLAITVKGTYLPFFYELGLLDCVPYPIAQIAPGAQVADDGNGVYLTGNFTAEVLQETILNEETGYMTHPSVVSGPYKLVSYEDGVAKFEVNPEYKGDTFGHKPQILRVIFQSMGQEELIPALQDGSIGLVNKATGSALIDEGFALTAEDTQFTSANYARTGVSFISFNADRGAVASKNVRQAIAYALNKDQLTSETVSTYGLRTYGYYGLGQWMYQLLNGTIAYPVEETDPEYAAKQAEWEALTLDEIEKYDQDTAKAAELLDADGWNLNSEGNAFQAGTDTLRYKKTESGLEPLKLTLAYPEGSAAGAALESELPEALKAAGIELTIEAKPMNEILPQYYHVVDCAYDMFFLATNFDLVYDPSAMFIENEQGEHVWRTSALVDEKLYNEAVAMRKTAPGDLLTYCKNWLNFQKEFVQELPVLPIYSNIYFDFYNRELHEYPINTNISWAQAIAGSYLAEAEELVEEPAEDANLEFGD